jgi:hypothetical protein
MCSSILQSVFTKPTNNDLPSTRIQSKNNIRPIIIEKLLTNINPSKASGPDNMPNRILKECAIHLAPILKTILQCSLDTQRLERCKHLEYLQKRRQTPTRKHQLGFTRISGPETMD